MNSNGKSNGVLIVAILTIVFTVIGAIYFSQGGNEGYWSALTTFGIAFFLSIPSLILGIQTVKEAKENRNKSLKIKGRIGIFSSILFFLIVLVLIFATSGS